ncbi:MAG: carotenoid 1,2-hydratase, partial [Burkholderiales bacterium]|nr:carotenoid 1,2-hydratase [Burkholderiales bacterium]
LAWQGPALQVDVDERTAPRRQPLRGTVRLAAPALVDRSYALDAADHHHWHPIAPCARMEVAFSRPALRWQGSAYLDSNTGSRPMEDDFVRWDWLRAPLADGRTAVLYDGQRRDGRPFSVAQAFDDRGQASDFAPAPALALPASKWGVARVARCDAGAQARTVQSLEDGPFYARGLLATRLGGETVTAVHESLSLDRFRARWVQALLPFRMRRMGHWLP